MHDEQQRSVRHLHRGKIRTKASSTMNLVRVLVFYETASPDYLNLGCYSIIHRRKPGKSFQSVEEWHSSKFRGFSMAFSNFAICAYNTQVQAQADNVMSSGSQDANLGCTRVLSYFRSTYP